MSCSARKRGVLAAHQGEARFGHHVEHGAEQGALEAVFDVADVVEQAGAGEARHEDRTEVEAGDDVGAAGLEKASLPDLAETLADHEVVAPADALEGARDARQGVDVGAGQHLVQRAFV